MGRDISSDAHPGVRTACNETSLCSHALTRWVWLGPIVLGQLGQFPAKPWDKYREQVNIAHIAVSKRMEGVALVPSDGLNPNSDIVHFDTRSLRIFGKRYAEAYLKLAD